MPLGFLQHPPNKQFKSVIFININVFVSYIRHDQFNYSKNQLLRKLQEMQTEITPVLVRK